jgi:fructose-1,6-bisphosphatase/inositol monophosphatase family enzyme
MAYTLNDAAVKAALELATKAANAAAALMDECYERRMNQDASFDLGMDTKSTDADLVTQYDKKCEEIIIDMLTGFTADVDGSGEKPFRFLTEESRPDEPLLDWPTWIVDPIDGTTGFVHNSFDCGVSIGLTLNKQSVMGVVVLPRLRETFTAIRGEGAFMNGRRIRSSGCTQPNKAVFCTHCPYKRTDEAMDSLLTINRELMVNHRVHALRGYGSAAMDACSVAMGRLDCYFEVGIQAWDMCAAVVILREAGCTVLDVNGGDIDLTRRCMVAAATPELAQVAVALSTKYNYRSSMLGSA